MMDKMMHTMYQTGTLLLSIVQEGVGEELVEATKEAGARGGTILVARGVADNAILHMLGLGDTHKEVVLTLLGEQEVEPVVASLCRFRRDKRLSCGIAMLIGIPAILRHKDVDARSHTLDPKEGEPPWTVRTH